MRSNQMFANIYSYAQYKNVPESLSCIDTQNRTKTTAEKCQKMHRRDGISLVSCLPILAVCRSRHSSQTCIGIGRFRMQADVLVTSTPKSKISKSGQLYYRFGAICGLLRWSSKRWGTYVDLCPDTTCVWCKIRTVKNFFTPTHALHEKQNTSNDQVGHRRMIIDMMPVDALTKMQLLENCS